MIFGVKKKSEFKRIKNKEKENDFFSEYNSKIQKTNKTIVNHNPEISIWHCGYFNLNDPNIICFPQKTNQHQRSLLCIFKYPSSLKASTTVEISLVLPLFLVAMISILFLLEMMLIQLSVRSGMQEVASTFGSTLLTQEITNRQMESELINSIGEASLDRSILVDGSSGFDISESEIDQKNGAVKLVVSYELQLPFPQFLQLGLPYQETLIFKRWTGYGGGAYFANTKLVYISEHQSVYHLDISCSHLQLEISMVSASSIINSGNNYSPCGTCKPGELSGLTNVYTTATGGSYHKTLECSSLKRTISSVALEDVIGKGVCQRCG